MRNLIPALFAIAFLASCSSEPEINNKLVGTHTPLVQKIFYSDDSLLHGISLGMKKDEVKKMLAPGDSLTEEEDDYLLAEGRYDQSKYYTWECEFDSAGLFSITLDIYLTDEQNATEWYKDITAYFTDKYGNPTDDGLALTWEIKNAKRPARLELYEDTDYPYGKLSVYYYDLAFIPLNPDSIPNDSVFLPSDMLQ